MANLLYNENYVMPSMPEGVPRITHIGVDLRVLGAAALGDIGQHFPPSDPRWKGASSDIFLRHAAQLIRSAGGQIDHVDCTVIGEEPRPAYDRVALTSFFEVGDQALSFLPSGRYDDPRVTLRLDIEVVAVNDVYAVYLTERAEEPRMKVVVDALLDLFTRECLAIEVDASRAARRSSTSRSGSDSRGGAPGRAACNRW